MNQSRLTDAELIIGLRNNAACTFKTIYDIYWIKLYQVAYRKTGKKEVAEELVQEIFLNLWLKRNSLVLQNSLESYLFTAVKYAVINHYQAQLVRKNYKQTVENTSETANYTEEAVLTEELHTLFKKALLALSYKTQHIFEKSRLQHLSNKEIAQDLQLTDKAVEFHITKSLKHLKIYLKDFVLPILLFLYSHQ